MNNLVANQSDNNLENFIYSNWDAKLKSRSAPSYRFDASLARIFDLWPFQEFICHVDFGDFPIFTNCHLPLFIFLI